MPINIESIIQYHEDPEFNALINNMHDDDPVKDIIKNESLIKHVSNSLLVFIQKLLYIIKIILNYIYNLYRMDLGNLQSKLDYQIINSVLRKRQLKK